MDPESGASTTRGGARLPPPPDSGAGEVLRKLAQVENLVADAMSCTGGAGAGAAAAAVDAAVRRARAKARMLPSLGTDLVLAALDEVAWEIASMPEASVANAALMRRLTEEGMPAAAAAAPPDQPPSQPSPSLITQRGEPPSELFTELSVEEKGASAAGAPARAGGSDAGATGAPSSVLSVLRGGSEGGAAEEDMESTAGTSEAGAAAADTAARLVDPLRRLAAEAAGADEAAPLRRTLLLKKPKSGDMRLARSLDFDECGSPRAGAGGGAPAAALGAPPRARGACLEYGIGPEGDPQAVEPLHPDMDQFSPMGPPTPQQGGPSAAPGGGTGKIITLKGHTAPQPSRIPPRPIVARQVPLGGSPGSPGSPRRAWRALGALRSRSASASPPASPLAASGGLDLGATAAEEGMPAPGLLPTARVEGRGEAAGGFGPPLPEADAEGRVEAGESEMGELCSQLQGGLGV